MRGFFHHYLVPMWEEDFLLQASLMGVTFLFFWVRGICPDRGWGRFHTLRGVKDTPAGPYVGDRGAAGLLGWIRSAERRCRSRLGGTRGRPGAHPAAPLILLCGSLPELRTVPWGLRGDGDKGALPPSRAASSSPFPLPPSPPLGAGAPPRQILLPRAALRDRLRRAGAPLRRERRRAASPRLPPCPPAAAGLSPPSASPAPWLLLVLPRVIFIASIFCAGINK